MRSFLYVLTACLAMFAAGVNGAIVNLAADLTPGQEVNAPTLGGNSPFGTAAMVLDTTSGDFHWLINFTDLTGDLQRAHFHLAPPGSNGPIQFSIFEIDPANPTDASITSAIIDNSASGSLSGVGVLDGAEITAILAGDWYLNLHTLTNRGGEIRGQVLPAGAGTFSPVPLPAAAWFLLSGLAVLGVSQRRAR